VSLKHLFGYLTQIASWRLCRRNLITDNLSLLLNLRSFDFSRFQAAFRKAVISRAIYRAGDVRLRPTARFNGLQSKRLKPPEQGR
jgi:hypothetical protein